MFIFDIDPQNEKLEATKNFVIEDTTKARNKLKNNPAQQKFKEDQQSDEESKSSDSSQESDDNQPEEQFSSMGCKFNPNDMKKIKEEMDAEEAKKKDGYVGDHDEEMEGDAENL